MFRVNNLGTWLLKGPFVLLLCFMDCEPATGECEEQIGPETMFLGETLKCVEGTTNSIREQHIPLEQNLAGLV